MTSNLNIQPSLAAALAMNFIPFQPYHEAGVGCFALMRALLSWFAIVAASAFLMSQTTFAESPWTGIADPIFQHLPTDPDTPDSIVLAIAQDHEGFIWIGTEEGLLRWDGYNYRHYRADRGNPFGLPDDFVQSLHVDSAGTLWIGTLSGGLSRYDRYHDRFSTYRSDTHSLSSIVVRAITDDGAGGVWAATNHGIDEVSSVRGEIRQIHQVDRDPLGLPDDNVRAVLRDHIGRVWIGTRRGLAYLDPSGRTLINLKLSNNPKKELNVVSLYEDHEGHIWVGTRSGAYVAAAAASEKAFSFKPVPGSESYQVISLIEVRPGLMWLGTYGNGIAAVDMATLKTTHIHHDPLLPNSLNEDTPWTLYRDHAGDIWVATNRGVSRFDSNQHAIMTIYGVISRKHGLADNDVEAVLPMPDGRIWLGLGSTGINVFDPMVGRIAEFRKGRDSSGTQHPLGEVRGLALSDAGEVFLCTRDGLYRKTVHDREPLQIPLPRAMAVRTIAVQGSTLWLGTLDDGLLSLNLHAGGRVQAYPRSDQLTDPRVSAILADTANSLWVGTINGLNHIDLVTGQIEHFGPQYTTGGALVAPYISTLLLDRKGRLWVGTQSGGISILEGSGAERHAYHLGAAEGLPNLNIDKMLESVSGDVWATTDNGLAVIDPVTLKARKVGRAEGAVISSYWVNAGATAADGALLFGGTDGMTIVKPQQFTNYHYHPRIAVGEFRLGGQEIPWAQFVSGSMNKTILIQPAANSFSVDFSALDYSAPERNRYAYRLDGYDSTWITTDWRHRTAAYTNLPPGRYVLRLSGSNRDGDWTKASVTLPIEVLPSWYQTLWFKAVVALAAMLAIAALMRIRTTQLRRRQHELEQEVARQTNQLRARERQLEQLAYLDPLTGLANRRMLTDRFDQLCKQFSDSEELALLLIDLDRFKQINDSLGHDAGDALLIATSRRLRDAVRDSDQVFRLGGDEFAVLLVEIPDRAAVEAVCEKIICEVVAPVPFNGVEMNTSPSIGISRFPVDGRSLTSLLKLADLALYEAKREGRKTWRWGRLQRTEERQSA
jgi:diguanylate cyclase (GGDEF)-like protein